MPSRYRCSVSVASGHCGCANCRRKDPGGVHLTSPSDVQLQTTPIVKWSRCREGGRTGVQVSPESLKWPELSLCLSVCLFACLCHCLCLSVAVSAFLCLCLTVCVSIPPPSLSLFLSADSNFSVSIFSCPSTQTHCIHTDTRVHCNTYKWARARACMHIHSHAHTCEKHYLATR